MRWALAVVVAWTIVTAPLAAGAPADGVLFVQGDVRVGGDLGLTLENAAAYLNGTHRVSSLRGSAASVTVERYQETLVEAPLVVTTVGASLASSAATYALTDVAISLAEGEHGGWLGLYDVASVQMAAPHALLNGSAATTIGNSPNPERPPKPHVYTFALSRVEPHVAMTMQGGLAVRGDIMVKVSGLDLRMDAAENSTTLRTGTTREGAAGAQSERREDWVVLTMRGAELVLEGDPDVEAVAAGVTARWSGSLEARTASGQMRSEGKVLTPRAVGVHVTGDWEAALRPTRAAEGFGLQVDLRGDLVESDMQSLAARTSIAPVRAWWLWGGATLLAGVATALALRARRPRALGLDELLELGRLAAEAGRHGEAAEWFERACALAPTSSVVLGELAHSLGETGRHEDALATYERASALGASGEHDLDAARLLLRIAPSDDPRIARLLLRALERSPELYVEVMEMEEVSRAPDVRAAVTRAAARAERDDPR